MVAILAATVPLALIEMPARSAEALAMALSFPRLASEPDILWLS
jgi:hypothetical protein